MSDSTDAATRPASGGLELNKEGFSLIHRAVVQKNNLRIEKLLSISPLSLEAKTTDKCRLTPLLVAAKYGCEETFHFLLKMGSKTNVRSSRGFNAVQCALVNNQHRLVGSLLGLPQFTVFKDIFGTVTIETLSIAELANCLGVLNGVISSNVVNTAVEEATRSQYEEEIMSENGLNVLINLIKMCLKRGGETERELGPIIAAILENLCFSKHLLKEVLASTLPEHEVRLMENMTSKKGLTSLIHANANLISNESGDATRRMTSIHAPRAALRAIKRSQDSELLLTCITCMLQLVERPEVAENFHEDGVLGSLAEIAHQGDGGEGCGCRAGEERELEIRSITIQILTKVAAISERFRIIILETNALQMLLKKMTKKSKLIIVIIDLLRVMCVQNGDTEQLIKESKLAISTLVNVTKYSFSTYYQHKAFQILWALAQDDTTERRSLGFLVGPTGLLNMLNITSESHLYTVTMALNLISPPIYEKQAEIIERGGITQLLYTLQVTTPPTQLQVLCILENCSHDVSYRPLVEMQDAFMHEKGVQVLLKLSAQSHDRGVRFQGTCSLAAASISNATIKKLIAKDSAFSLLSLINSLFELDPTKELSHLLLVVRSLSYLAYNSLKLQKMILDTSPLPLSVYRALMASEDPMTSTEVTFHSIVLAPTFDERQDEVEIVASGIRHLILSLRVAIEEGADELQIHICMFVSALLRMRAGICQAFIAADLVSLLVRVIFSPFENGRKTAAIALNYLARDQEGRRVLLRQCRKHVKLYDKIVQHSDGYTLDEEFQERWKHYCVTVPPPKPSKTKQKCVSITAAALAYKGARCFSKSVER